MQAKLIAIIEKYTKDYAIVPYIEGQSHIVFCLPYKPYKENATIGYIDAYYRVSNISYFLTKEIVAELNGNGFVAKVEKRHIYKNIAVKSGLTSPILSGLTAHSRYGTRIVLGLILLDGSFQKLSSSALECLNCNKCQEACPNSVIRGNAFEQASCIRQLQEDGAKWDLKYLDVQRMGNRIIGCDICQKVCPLNAEIGEVEMPPKLAEMLDIDNFIAMTSKGKSACTELIEFIGYNYLRPNKLLSIGLSVAINMNKYNSCELVNELTKSENDIVSNNAKWYMRMSEE